MSGKTIVIILAVIIVVFLAILFFVPGGSSTPSATGNSPAQQTQAADNSANPVPAAPQTPPAPAPVQPTQQAPVKATIIYTNSGFSPNTLTIQAGTTVVFENQSSGAFWPASNNHPTHTLYDGTTLREHCAQPTSKAFDACGGIAPGSSWSFTFNKVGTWTYHDHMSAGEGGTVVVQ